MAAVRKERLLFGVFLLILIVAIELVLHRFHLPTWPAFMIMIFYFETHMDKSRAPHLILGGAVGIVCYMLTAQFVEAWGPAMGTATARLLCICLAVYAIVAFGEVLPMVFNNYAFMLFLVSGLAANLEGMTPEPWLWLGIQSIGGTIVILAIIGIGKLMSAITDA